MYENQLGFFFEWFLRGLKKLQFNENIEQGLERYLRYQAPHIRPPISGPPYEAPHIKSPISDPPYQAPHIGPPHIKPPIAGPLQYQDPISGWIFFTCVIFVTVIVTASHRTSENTLPTFYSRCFAFSGPKKAL